VERGWLFGEGKIVNKREGLTAIGRAEGLQGEELQYWVNAMDQGAAISEAKIREDGVLIDNRNIRPA